MKTYLDKKGIKFEDERLNKAINVVALAKGGKEKMDFLLSYLTSESIDAINAKRYIIGIPLKKGYFMESMLDDVADPSYSTTMQVLCILDDYKFHQFSFNLSYFHNKSIKSNPICSYDTGIFKIDEDGNVISKAINEDKSMFFHVINEGENNDGVKTLIGGAESKFKKDYISKFDMDGLFEFIRDDLKSRNYYQRLDKETYKLYYPGKYEYYNTKEQLKIAEVIEKVSLTHDLMYDMHYKNYDEDENIYMSINMLLRELEESDYSEFAKYMSCDDYLKKHNLEKFPYIEFGEWINDKGSIVHVEETDDTLMFNKKEDSPKTVYEFYNPNKMRYEDEEEEEVIVKRR